MMKKLCIRSVLFLLPSVSVLAQQFSPGSGIDRVPSMTGPSTSGGLKALGAGANMSRRRSRINSGLILEGLNAKDTEKSVGSLPAMEDSISVPPSTPTNR